MSDDYMSRELVQRRREERKEEKRRRKAAAIAAKATVCLAAALATDNLPVAASNTADARVAEDKTLEMLPLTVIQTAKTSTCQKRVVVCSLYDANGKLLACESNHCEPVGGVCCRIAMQSQREGYPQDTDCESVHAEIRALEALPAGAVPVLAILYGHKWPCPACDAALRAVGVREIQVVPDGDGIGLKPQALPPVAVRHHRGVRCYDYDSDYGPHQYDHYD